MANPSILDAPLTAAIVDVLLERKRQVEVEGCTPEHDDQHARGEMAYAAACYALLAANRNDDRGYADKASRRLWRRVGLATKRFWPWDWSGWKPKNTRRDLVRAATLLIAEIERIDRAAEKGAAS